MVNLEMTTSCRAATSIVADDLDRDAMPATPRVVSPSSKASRDSEGSEQPMTKGNAAEDIESPSQIRTFIAWNVTLPRIVARTATSSGESGVAVSSGRLAQITRRGD